MRGAAIAVTADALMNQWAEMHTIARGRGIDAASSDHAVVYRLSSSAFMGLP